MTKSQKLENQFEDQFRKIEEPLPFGVQRADFSYWARMNKWSASALTALLLGAEPGLRIRTPGPRDTPEERARRPFDARFKRILDLVLDHWPYARADYTISVAEAMDWIQRMRLPCPPELIIATEQFSDATTDWKKKAEESSTEIDALKQRIAELEQAIVQSAVDQNTSPREKESLLKLVLVMAIKGYSFDPKANRSGVPTELADDITDIGLALSDDTIRKYLREACELLPSDFEK